MSEGTGDRADSSVGDARFEPLRRMGGGEGHRKFEMAITDGGISDAGEGGDAGLAAAGRGMGTAEILGEKTSATGNHQMMRRVQKEYHQSVGFVQKAILERD